MHNRNLESVLLLHQSKTFLLHWSRCNIGCRNEVVNMDEALVVEYVICNICLCIRAFCKEFTYHSPCYPCKTFQSGLCSHGEEIVWQKVNLSWSCWAKLMHAVINVFCQLAWPIPEMFLSCPRILNSKFWAIQCISSPYTIKTFYWSALLADMALSCSNLSSHGLKWFHGNHQVSTFCIVVTCHQISSLRVSKGRYTGMQFMIEWNNAALILIFENIVIVVFKEFKISGEYNLLLLQLLEGRHCPTFQEAGLCLVRTHLRRYAVFLCVHTWEGMPGYTSQSIWKTLFCKVLKWKMSPVVLTNKNQKNL